MTSSVIVTIVVILGIVIAGGFLLYFLGDLLMSLSNKNKDANAIKNKQKEEQKALEERVKALENSEELRKDPQLATILYNDAVVEEYNPNETEETVTEVEETPVEETTEEAPVEETPVEEATEEPVEEPVEETTEDEDDDDTSEFIRQRRLELMERLVKMQEAENESEESTDDAVDVSEESEETVEETPAEETTEEVEETPVEEATEEPVEETTEESADDSTVNNVVVDTKFEEAKAQSEETGVNTLASTMTLDELEAKLADEQEKLKANEKELRQCKKEYLPLRRVKNTLENDEKKLRRKEALVAKQKVVLYGVNNYADIDEEKAKKLAEDLDLLDGLKLSVQHCEEVMSKNQERFPLLEKIYNLLSSQNEELKGNINELQEAIAELKAQGEGDETPADAE